MSSRGIESTRRTGRTSLASRPAFLRRTAGRPRLRRAAAVALRRAVDAIAQRWVERLEERDPVPLTPRDLVELLLHPRRELDVDVVAKVFDEEVCDDPGDGLGKQPPFVDPDVASIDDRRDRRRVR